jgi:hypothetical protein
MCVKSCFCIALTVNVLCFVRFGHVSPTGREERGAVSQLVGILQIVICHICGVFACRNVKVVYSVLERCCIEHLRLHAICQWICASGCRKPHRVGLML